MAPPKSAPVAGAVEPWVVFWEPKRPPEVVEGVVVLPPPKRPPAGFGAELALFAPPNRLGDEVPPPPPPKSPPLAGADVAGVVEPALPNIPPEAGVVEAAGFAPKRPPPVLAGVVLDAGGVEVLPNKPPGFWVAPPPKRPPVAGVVDPGAPAGVLFEEPPPRLPKEKEGVPVAVPKRLPEAGADEAGLD